MNLPLGFEEYPNDLLTSNTKFDDYNNNSKKLVLIAAPTDFDAQTLKGKRYVVDGVHTINDYSGTEKWEINASLAKCDEHLNVLLSTGDGNIQIVPQIEDNVNIVRNIVIPPVKYPKVSKEIKRLPKPTYLKPRWQPFGSGDPVIVQNGIQWNKNKNVENQQGMKQIKINLPSVKSDKFKKQENTINEDTPEKKKKKKKKKKQIVEENKEETKKDKKDEFQNEIVLDDNKAEEILDTKTTPKKKKKRNKENKNNEHSKSDTKTTIQLKQEIESDIDSDTEQKVFGLKQNIDETPKVPPSTKKKKRKRKSAAPVDNNVSVVEKKVKIENADEENVLENKTKKKKKNKNKKRSGGD